MSATLAKGVLDAIRTAGVEDLCVCPGGRNAEWVRLLSSSAQFRVTWFYEERAAAFFAVGRIKATGKPTAVVTTSGTAVGELLPATMEAHYSGLPLVLLTADRPRRFRGSGAPQAAEQVGLFGVYATCVDLEGDDRIGPNVIRPDGPTHINTCFEDPIGEGGEVAAGTEVVVDRRTAIFDFLAATQRPIVIVGALHPRERATVKSFLSALDAPSYAEGPSGLRDTAGLWLGHDLLARARRNGYDCDGVLRIGGVPTLRAWRDLEDRYSEVPVMSVSERPFSGLARKSRIAVGILDESLDGKPPATASSQAFREEDRRLGVLVDELLAAEPTSEPGIVRALSARIPTGASVYLGNSLPVREWDLAAVRDRDFEVSASRGLNGIDGQLSTFLGTCTRDRQNWAVLGDLTALYDLGGAWPIRQMDPDIQASIVILNNGGGRIFDRMFDEKAFQNEHSISFENWAKLWGLGYQRCEQADGLEPAKGGPRVIEMVPNREATDRFWKEYRELLA